MILHELGKSLEFPIYKFVKEALVRKFGADWYDELEAIAKIENNSFYLSLSIFFRTFRFFWFSDIIFFYERNNF